MFSKLIKYINILGKYLKKTNAFTCHSFFQSNMYIISHFPTLLITHTVLFFHRLGSLKVSVQVVVNNFADLETLTTEYIISMYGLLNELFEILGKTGSAASIILLDEKSNTSGT